MKELASLLEQAKTVAIAGHVRPDGDCVGSCLATYNYIRTWFPDIETDVYLEPVPNIFKFLKGSGQIHHTCDSDRSYDLCIVQDCGDTKRLGEAVKYFKTARRTLCIDHHVSNESFADVNYIFPEVSSTSELIFDLIEKDRITKEIAECLYVGIVHDTGVFQYSSTSAKTMNIAGILMETGIDFTKIVDDTFYTKTYEQNKILGQALLNSVLYLDGACIASAVSKEEMERYSVLPKHLDGIVSQLRVTKDVQAAIFLYEVEDAPKEPPSFGVHIPKNQGTDRENTRQKQPASGCYKVSMRSNGNVNVADIAMKYGGGGHIRAAGVTMAGTPEQIIRSLCEELKKQI